MMKSVIATILSLFIPGLGQLYKGHLLWAIFWFVLLVSGYCSFLTMGPLVIIAGFLHLLCLIQAFLMKN